jgi:UDP-galactopyranose mutase
MHFDFLIVGAGFSGLTFAERAATQLGARSLIVDRRAHIGGNAFDKYDDQGVLIHPYGPHYFRTNSPRVCDEIRARLPRMALHLAFTRALAVKAMVGHRRKLEKSVAASH